MIRFVESGKIFRIRVLMIAENSKEQNSNQKTQARLLKFL